VIRPALVAALWLLGGSVVSGGLFWWLLNTSEATAFTLALSALLAVASFTAAARALTGAVAVWHRTDGTAHRRGAAWWLVWLVAMLVGHALWFAMHAGLDWLGDHAGELSAWAIVQFDVSDITPLLTAVEMIGSWVATVVVGFVMVTCGAAALEDERQPGWLARALRHALHPLRLMVVSAVMVLTVVVPQQSLLYAVPRGLPPTWVQPALAAAKLGLMAILAAAGAALVLRLAVAARAVPDSDSPTAP
jgi:hypothetical protein